MRLNSIPNVTIVIQETQRHNRKAKRITVYDTDAIEVYAVIFAAIEKACFKNRDKYKL